jgi:hypothetical protein
VLRAARGPRHARVAAALLSALAVLAAGLVATPEVSGDARAATPVKGSPYGVGEHIWYQRPPGLTVIGWVIDPSAQTRPVTVHVTVDTRSVGSVRADDPRPDVARAHPAAGANHGFRFFAKVPEGRHTICIRAKDVGAGVNVNLRCQTRTLDYGPSGAVQSLRASSGRLTVSGWTADFDRPAAPVTTVLTVDGKRVGSVPADDINAAAKKALPKAGAKHGFSFSRPLTQGKHSVCVRAVNIGYGKDKTLVCRTVTLNDSPRGELDYAKQYRGKLRVRGWAYDPNAATSAATVLVKVGTTTHTVVASATRTDLAARYPSAGAAHGFDVKYALPEGAHTVCVTFRNVAYGSDVNLPCVTARLRFTPTATVTGLTARSTGARVTGWASDPDTSAAVPVEISLDGQPPSLVTADGAGTTHDGHNFTADITTRSGAHTLCAVARNVSYGTRNSAAVCTSITLALSPLGRFESLVRAAGSTDLRVAGWAFDPDSTAAVGVRITLDGQTVSTLKAAGKRTDIATKYPSAGANRGLTAVLPADDQEHSVCLTAINVGGGSNKSLGCKIINAVHPVVPTAPRAVTALAGYGGATVSWTAPASDGGAPWTKYVVTASPGGLSTTAGATATSATVIGLKPSTSYSFTVTAVNVAGTSAAGRSAAVRTQAAPPPQTTPAPVSTSRYIRNVRGSSPAELATMRAEGLADAKANPSGHGYLVLLDIGGQDRYNNGVVLSATTRFVSYADLVKDIQAYIDGYAAGQRPSAPVTIAVGTNNDMDVSAATGKAWADSVIDPLVAYARKYSGVVIAGANDIEPGFRATYSQTKSWLTGYLGATKAPFVFNGSADGCAWTVTNRSCNNGWTMAGLYYLAAGAAPVRMLNLPQIYNYTMADQWKYISLTGVGQGQPRINFAGTLTEVTACVQANNSCGSITGRSAWSRMWANLQSDSRLKVGSLPYATDLRIDQ